MTSWKEQLGAAIQAAREGMGLSQRALAKAAGVSGELIRQYELGNSAPVVDKLARIAGVLKVNEFTVNGYKFLANATTGQRATAPEGEQLTLELGRGTIKIRASRVEIAIDAVARRGPV